MLCEKCGKNTATTQIRSIINGVVSEKHLCSKCAASESYDEIGADKFSQLLLSMFGDTVNIHKTVQVPCCHCCGSTISDIAQSGKCGCPECYTTFYEQLLPYLRKVHGRTQHTGKSPNRVMHSSNQNENSVEQLRAVLKQLIAEEKYEQAAVVRDKIKKIEGDAQ